MTGQPAPPVKISGRFFPLLFLLGLPACSVPRADGPPREIDPAAYGRELAAWRAARAESIAGPDGWITLAGLHWLDEGKTYKLGGDPASDIVLPRGHVPDSLGTVSVRSGSASFTSATGAVVTSDRAPVSAIALRSDKKGQPTVLASGSVTIRAIERSGRLALRVKDSMHPARAAFRGLQYFPVSPDLRVEAVLEPADASQTLELSTVVGRSEAYPAPGTLVFKLLGKTCRLRAVQEPDASELFIIFSDATSGAETYPSGRFLNAPEPDASGRTLLDFNKAYNPPCAFTPYATCPLPPAGNELPVPVRAGELYSHAEK